MRHNGFLSVRWRALAAAMLISTSGWAMPARSQDHDHAPSDAAGEGQVLPGADDPTRLPAPLAITRELRYAPSAVNLREYHDLLASRPHVAGSPGDLQVVETIYELFQQMELSAEKHAFWAYLPRPIVNHVEIVGPEPMTLELRERALDEDADTAHPELTTGWNAYSGDGDVTGEVVYANYGTLEDFRVLKERGVDLAGKVVLARYGKNFRGFKARFAQEAGAAAILIYSDPADSGFGRGGEYPEGGFHNDSCIERGSVLTLPYAGDPLTPFVEATENAERLSPVEVDLPRIPVQPISWASAREIMRRMSGEALPEDLSAWRGKMPAEYRLTGGAELRVRVRVQQERTLVKTYNVIGVLAGAEEPGRGVIVGCHHDAWGFGASDPMSGMIALLETARVMSELSRAGSPPRRSVVFAAWGAEEFGIIGSTEWVESQTDALQQATIAYLNLDMASMGPQFGSAAAPTLRPVIIDAARAARAARSPERTVLDEWLGRGADPRVEGAPVFGELGGGSDHVAFWCHAGIASASLGGGGSPGTAYHTAYDTLAWYRKVVGEDYEPARMVADMTIGVVRRLAGETIIPLDLERVGVETLRQLESVSARGRELGFFTGEGVIAPELGEVEREARRLAERAGPLMRLLRAVPPSADEAKVSRVNELLMSVDRAWLSDRGVPSGGEGRPDRPWFKNLYSASDETSGYAAWTLPALRAAVERQDRDMLLTQTRRYLNVYARLDVIADELETLAAGLSGAGSSQAGGVDAGR